MEIIGHKRQRQFLQKIAELKKIPHAYLFTGQEKLGKKRVALEWISSLFNKDVQENYHPDLILIPQAPVESEGEEPVSATEPQVKEIQIDQIRNLIRELSLKLYSAPLKAVIIDRAHLMNQEAQSALLKILEEPRGEVVLILVTEFPGELFPTILSRVQTVKFYPVKREEIEEYLRKKGISEKEREKIAKISMGRPGKAIDLISDPQKIKAFEEKIKKLNEIFNSSISFRFQYAKDLSQDLQDTKETLDVWLSYFRDILLGQCLNSGVKYFNDSTPGCPIFKLRRILRIIQDTNFLISTTNVDTKLAMERLMLEF